MMRKSSKSCSYMEKVVLSSSDKNQNMLNDRLYVGRAVGSIGMVNDAAADLLSTWPPRHYTCSFCRRRFKSAQALGGHMNVHRRARAMLRTQSISSPCSSISPWHPTNSISPPHHPLEIDETHTILPNPNPICPLVNTHHHTRNPTYPYILSHLPTTSIASSSTFRHKYPLSAAASARKQAPGGLYHHAELIKGENIRTKKNCIIRAEDKLNGLLCKRITQPNDELVRLSLGNGMITDSSSDEQDIDLELRL